jgi:MoaA/NifB/PqqE/SkfB family radical SAM enzyme
MGIILLVPNNLLASGRLHHAMVELTTDCNLRCVYCAVSQPNWQVQSLAAGLVDQVIVDLQKLGTKVIVLHGHGETTIVPNWVRVAEKFLNAGFALSTCTNLTKVFTNDEYNILAKFGSITVSLDTIDPLLFRRLRKGGDVAHLIYNFLRIKALETVPIRWIWSSVICDQTIWDILPLIKFGHFLGVKVFCLCNLTVEDHCHLRHISQLSTDEARHALLVLDEAEAYCLEHGLDCDIKAGLLDSLRSVLYGKVLGAPRRRLYPLVP